MRLDKYLSDMTDYSRNDIKKLVKDKRVTVNGITVNKSDLKVSEADVICIDDEPVEYETFEYYMLNKPAGYLCTLDYSPNVLELIDSNRKGLSPVGRLDKDTEGLILITNDGQLNHRLLAPKHHVDKTYYVETDVEIKPEAVEIMSKPMQFEDFTSEPAKLEIQDKKKAYLTIHEGKFHQVKRMFAKIGCNVTYLKRVSFGPLQLGDLEVGQYRKLTKEEAASLK
ncbi:MAG: rRNA pseudouridine synthase [Erysipelotrichaceae bacterium]|nr:rRNA pseudouridine synthase [Erysipelotrichaceae bacterium]